MDNNFWCWCSLFRGDVINHYEQAYKYNKTFLRGIGSEGYIILVRFLKNLINLYKIKVKVYGLL